MNSKPMRREVDWNLLDRQGVADQILFALTLLADGCRFESTIPGRVAEITRTIESLRAACKGHRRFGKIGNLFGKLFDSSRRDHLWPHDGTVWIEGSENAEEFRRVTDRLVERFKELQRTKGW